MIKLDVPFRVRCIDNQGSGKQLSLGREYTVIEEIRGLGFNSDISYLIQGETHPWTETGGFAYSRFEILP